VSARPTRPVDAVVFDMDGTLFDSSTVVPDAYIETIVGLGGPSYTREQIVDTYRLGPSGPMIEYLLGRRPTEPDIAAYHAALARTASRVSVYPGVPEALDALAARVPLAVFTGADVRACSMLMEAVGLARFFHALVGADEVPASKPAPDGIHLACRRLGVDASRAAYVGDADIDLAAARRSGAVAAAAAWGHQFRPGVEADVVLAHPSDLLLLVGSPVERSPRGPS
jgi:HAD superfamily hydrolase (TIGR01549 family)